jgi:hypothetical protein
MKKIVILIAVMMWLMSALPQVVLGQDLSPGPNLLFSIETSGHAHMEANESGEPVRVIFTRLRPLATAVTTVQHDTPATLPVTGASKTSRIAPWILFLIALAIMLTNWWIEQRKSHRG